jgi:Domain of unknown function (DUF222)/HNH endonuclease
MSTTALATATSLLAEAVAGVRGNSSAISGDELRDMLIASRELSRLVSQLQVETIAALERSGELATQGYNNPKSAVANALTLDSRRAYQLVRAAERVTQQLDADGQSLPPMLPAAAAMFAAGRASLAHVTVISRLMDTPTARRLTPEVRTQVEKDLAAVTDEHTAEELAIWGAQVIESLDHDRPDADDDEPVQVNELHLIPLPGGGGKIKGHFDDGVRFAAIAAMVNSMATPRTADDQRSGVERQADALADGCEFVLRYGNSPLLPDTGGERPQVMMTVELRDMENRLQAACLDYGTTSSPAMLRRMCCDAGVIPVVLDGAGQPLDIGNLRRTIPVAIRRAVKARDRGCAHPGCDRPPTWCEVHHIVEWAKGGPTRLNNLVMLCGVHHREIHMTGWIVRMATDGIPEFIPPAWLDREQKPRHQLRIPTRANPGGAPPWRPDPFRPATPRHRRISHVPKQ